MSDAPLISVESLSITHRDAARPTPDQVSFTVVRGEALLILGPSGCGKSTMSLALNGLVPKDVWADVSGRVTLGGRSLDDLTLPETSQHAAMVFQDPDAQMVASTVFDEVAFGPENLCVPVAEIETRVEKALRAVGLWDRREDAPDLLSGGGRQRLAIAAALAQGAPLVILDEPTANLDPRSTREVYDVLRRLLDENAIGVVLIEHNLDEALRIATRVLALGPDGRPVTSGTPREVFVTHGAELSTLGVWLPIATVAAAQLQESGWQFDKLPLTIDELRWQLMLTPAPNLPGLRALAPAATPSRDAPVVGEETGPILAARDLSVRRGRRTVLDDVTLGIRAGEFVAVVGPNGAGKTTLLQALAGIETPPRAAVTVEGRDVSRLTVRELRDRIGYVFQNPEHQFLAGTVREELSLELRSQKFSEDAIASRTEQTLTQFGLDEVAELHPFLLSGGQKRRLSVATALVSGAPVLVLDEPTFGQDQARAAELIAMLQELNDAGTTVVMATHDLQLAAEVTDRLVVVADGQIAADGPTADILARDVLLDVGLGLPPIATALRGMPAQPALSGVTRMRDLPGFTLDDPAWLRAFGIGGGAAHD